MHSAQFVRIPRQKTRAALKARRPNFVPFRFDELFDFSLSHWNRKLREKCGFMMPRIRDEASSAFDA